MGTSFSCRWLFSVCGGLSLRRVYCISPGWNRGGMIVRRPRSVLIPPETAAPFPAIRPAAGQLGGTICREANKKYSGRRHIPPHRPEEYSFRYRSCNIYVLTYASGGTADNS